MQHIKFIITLYVYLYIFNSTILCPLNVFGMKELRESG